MKTNTGLVQYARAQLGRPYWYGTFGQLSTETLYRSKKRQYPSYYTASNFLQQLNVKVHDCVGLIKGYMWCTNPEDTNPTYGGNGFPDNSANGLYNYCTVKSTDMKKMPDVPGIAVFMNNHVGVYIGGGQVIEARGHAYGVVQTALESRAWMKWAYIPGIEYGQASGLQSGGSGSTGGGTTSNGTQSPNVVTIDASSGKKKRLIIIGACLAAAVLAAVTAWLYLRRNKR